MAIIDKSTDYFRIKLYTGNNNAQTIAWDETDTNMKPDMLWIKSYAGNTVFEHVLGDIIRGEQKYLVPNGNAASVSNGNVINTFNTNGFSVGGATQTSESARSYIAWGWKASNTTASNTAGTINSTVSVNTTPGFSVVGYTGTGSGATVGHGLGVKPDMIFSKPYSTTGDWNIYHDSFSSQQRIKLNSTAGVSTNTQIFSSLPTSTLVSIGNSGDINANGTSHLFYCFNSVEGYSKFGSYTGTSGNNATAPFIYTGFKPAFFLVKNASAASAWEMYDNRRLGYNPNNYQLRANETAAQVETSDYVDFLSNGFKIRHNSSGINNNGDTFFYMSFAKNPFVTSTDNNSIPATAG